MSYWAFRVLKCRDKNNTLHFRVVEVHFDDQELYKTNPIEAITSWSSNPATLITGDASELQWIVKQINAVVACCADPSSRNKILNEWDLIGYEGP